MEGSLATHAAFPPHHFHQRKGQRRFMFVVSYSHLFSILQQMGTDAPNLASTARVYMEPATWLRSSQLLEVGPYEVLSLFRGGSGAAVRMCRRV